MLNDPTPEQREVREPEARRAAPRQPHPLERDPVRTPPPEGTPPQPRQQVMLHIPSVRPLVTYTLLAVNILIFIVRALSPEIDRQVFLWGANHQPEVLAGGEIYRLFTSMFLHASIFGAFGQYAIENSLHLVFNMYIIYSVGTQIERLFGHVRFALIYLLGGMTGSIMSAVLGGDAYSVGASGAAFAILGAEFVYLYQHRKLLGARGRAQMQQIITLAVINFGLGALTGLGGGAVRIDNWAHLGGAIGGLVLAWFIGPFFIIRRHPQNPNALLGEDINPLKNRYWVLSLYGAAMLVVLIVARGALA